MKRFHVHVSVVDLDESIRFYTALFAAEPAVVKSDYAKWMLDDPRINFAISRRGQKPGVDHLGMQVESAEALAEMNQNLQQAVLPLQAQLGTTCCYAESDKYWTVDPQGIPWEAFHTLASAPTFGEAPVPQQTQADSCCAPSSSCCTPTVTTIKFGKRQ